MSDDAITRVARDLSAITDLTAALESQAIAKANSPDHLPGGAAMVALGPVASHEAFVNTFDTAERLGRDTTYISDDDEDWAPPLQLLLFWSEALRMEQGQDYGQRPTIASEASYLRFALDHLWANEPHFDDFARDVNRARRRLEDVLHAGNRVERTRVPCIELDCERKPRLIRVYRESAALDHYRCPACKTSYTTQRYGIAKADLLASQDADRHVSMQDALNAIDRSDRTFRKWLRFWHVRSYRDPLTGTVMVWWPDVREMDFATPRRKRAVA